MPAGHRISSAAIKRLPPGAPGTKRLVERYGDALLCVRYRHDPQRSLRLTTVERVVEERPRKPEKTAWMRIAYSETELRQRIKAADRTWHPERKLWQPALKVIKSMQLETRVVSDAQ